MAGGQPLSRRNIRTVAKRALRDGDSDLRGPVGETKAPASPRGRMRVTRINLMGEENLPTSNPLQNPIPRGEVSPQRTPLEAEARVPEKQPPQNAVAAAACAVDVSGRKSIPIASSATAAQGSDDQTPTERVRIMTEPAKRHFDFNAAIDNGAKALSDLVEFHKSNLEAVAASSRLAAVAGEKVTAYMSEYAMGAMKRSNETFKSFTKVKNPAELLKLQGDLAKALVETTVAENSRTAQGYFKLMSEVYEPLRSRYAAVVTKLKLPSAV